MAFEYKIPNFLPQRVLTRSILYAVRDLSFLEQSLRFEEYSDGIISGCDLYEENLHIEIRSGMVKFEGRLYILKEPLRVPYQHTDNWTILKIVFSPPQESIDFDYYSGALQLADSTDLQPHEMEIGRFKLKKGSRLRTQYVDFSDMNTEFDTVNLIHIRQAAKGGETVSMHITNYFAREAYPYMQDNPLDIAFCSNCLASGMAMRREYIQHYVCNRLQMHYHEMDNVEIHKTLTSILHAVKTGSMPDTKRRPQKRAVLIE